MADLSWEDWVKNFKTYMTKMRNNYGWFKHATDINPETLKNIGTNVKEYLKTNPPPQKPPHKPTVHTPKVHVKPGTGTVDIKKLQTTWHTGGDALLQARRLRRGGQGASLVAVVAMGGASLMAIGAAVGVYIIEECTSKVGEMVLGSVVKGIYEIKKPRSRAQLDSAYNDYVMWRWGSLANKGITPQVLTKEEWVRSEFGIDINNLK